MGIFGWGRDETRQASDQVAQGVATAGAPDGGALGRARLGEGQSGLNGAATRLVERLLDVGIDGKGPVDSAVEQAKQALAQADGNVERAIKAIERDHRQLGAVGGFVTGLGGFFTMPLSLPTNVLVFHLLATRMTAATAHLRGYDIDAPEIRTAILLTLAGADSDDVLKKAGVSVGGGKLAALAVDRLPAPALMVLNKAVAFRLLGRIGQGTFAKLGRGVPVAGGLVGAGVDLYLLGRIADSARREFPPVSPFQP